MKPVGYHIVVRLADSRVIAPTTKERRILAKVILKQSKDSNLLVFRVVDSHLHLEPLVERKAAEDLVRRIKIAAQRSLNLGVEFGKTDYTPLRNQGHVRNAFTYHLDQEKHHGLNSDPFHDCSNLPDLLGMRLIGEYTIDNVKTFLPRTTKQDLLRFFGVQKLEMDMTADPRMVELSAAAAICAEDLSGQSKNTLAAKTAAVHVVNNQLSQRELADLLQTNRISLWRFKNSDPNPKLMKAIKLQMVLRAIKADNFGGEDDPFQ